MAACNNSTEPSKDIPTDSKEDLDFNRSQYVFFWTTESCFSQFFTAKFTVENQEYTCAEQYMMHQKAKFFGDEQNAEKILKSKSPKQIKGLGRKVKNFDEELWEAKSYDVVKTGNKHKFSQNPELKKELFATKGKVLVEASPLDTKWGIGLTQDDPRALDPKTWRGRNLLGYALTEVRDQLMREEGLLS